MTIHRALISVSDKEGVIELARGLTDAGVEIISSGGTATALESEGIPVLRVAEVTAAPEILGGRVKTLHPKIHGGILADRRKTEHMEQLGEHGIEPIDLVVCNLYPFESTIAREDVTDDDAIEQIDIGGPAMVRAAAKNFHSVAVVVAPGRYAAVLDEIVATGEVSLDTRRSLAVDAFRHTASYDAAITRYLGGDESFPESLLFWYEKVADLRYGENPHQAAAFYKDPGPAAGLAGAEQLHGKELSYNNLLDTDAAWALANDLEVPGAAIIKHSNPCGVAVAASMVDAYTRALECDPVSAFGGIVALNGPCDRDTAARIATVFTEVIIAPGYDAEALDLLTQKKNLRILRTSDRPTPRVAARTVAGGLLLQSADPPDRADDVKVVTRSEPTEQQMRDLRFAWVVAKHVRSNAIVLAKDGVAVGVGAGQMNRLESTELAARRAGERALGSVCASDAFFPFRDGLDAAVAAGAVAVIQPGGSVRDDEVIAAADEHGIPMVFTGRRHFRH
ncbi:MAG: bifunctional phosphoribosylaminoimidazolecarboxamide formyltransferase/IMP cyclohydrolase [Actinomycetota bacterium]